MQLVKDGYPGLLDSSRPQKVEIFVPLCHKPGSFTSTMSDNIPENDNLDLSLGRPGTPVFALQDMSPKLPLGAVLSGNHMNSSSWRAEEAISPSQRCNSLSCGSGDVATACAPSRRFSEVDSHRPRRNSHKAGCTRNDAMRYNGTSNSPGNLREPVHGKFSETSWEVLSRYSTTSHRLSIQQDLSDPHHTLVPLWECLQVSNTHPP